MGKETRETKESSYHRAKILSLIKKHGSLTISELSKQLKVTRPTVYLHLETLENRGLIIRLKDTSKKGSPVVIKLTKKAQPINLNVLETAHSTWKKITSS